MAEMTSSVKHYAARARSIGLSPASVETYFHSISLPVKGLHRVCVRAASPLLQRYP